MVKYLGVVSYLGKAYKGFERQKSCPTIQGTLEQVLSSLLDEPIFIHGAGRTDAGVNARGQTFSFSREKPLENPDGFANTLNRLLPKDIAVLSVREVPLSFDARHSSKGKTYSYSFHYGVRDPLCADECQLEVPSFDVALFKESMLLFLGTHDFRDFTTKPQDKDGFVRTIRSVDFVEEGPERLRTLISGNGFMTYMVRILVGVSFKVAGGKMSLGQVTALLTPSERDILSFKAPPEGLCLEEVIYE
jgi:tRNA pseudouridine38-40 synthase